MVPILNLVLWLSCLVVGVAGLVFPYARPTPPVAKPEPITVARLDVELIPDASAPPLAASVPAKLLQPPPLPAPVLPPPAPDMAVAAPLPQMAFAVPLPIVPAKEGSYRTPETPMVATTAPALAAPQPLTFGQGEGRQPAPEYPRQALRQGQEGIVTIRLIVGVDGRVTDAEASTPAPWPLLNDAALRVVRTRWRFAPGPMRAYEVAIRFELNQ